MSVTPPTAAPTADRRRARRGVLLFVGLVAVLDVLLMSVTVMTGDARWIFALMWSVAAASVICRLALREGFRDVSFRFGGLRTLAFVVAGFAFPIVFGAVVYGIAWISGLATYVSPQGGFFLMLLSAVTVGAAINMLLAAGEEIGWRGYLLTRMIDAGIPRPVLVGGVIWALWHVPGIVAGVYLAGSGSVAAADRDAVHLLHHRVRLRVRPVPACHRQHLARHRAARRLEQHHSGTLRRLYRRCKCSPVDRRRRDPGHARYGRRRRRHRLRTAVADAPLAGATRSSPRHRPVARGTARLLPSGGVSVDIGVVIGAPLS